MDSRKGNRVDTKVRENKCREHKRKVEWGTEEEMRSETYCVQYVGIEEVDARSETYMGID